MTGHVIVFGNEKGGSGKTTISAHVAVYIANEGIKVASIDLDARQKSFTRYIENRLTYARRNDIGLSTPHHVDYPEDQLGSSDYIQGLLSDLSAQYDVIVIDTPGSNTASSRAAHAMANTVITPVNDSFVDLDLLGQVKGDDLNNITPGIYSAMLWEQRLKHAKLKGGTIDWIVIRNRLANVEARNKQRVEQALELLSKKFGFRISQGFSERVIFRELFTRGLTLMDVTCQNTKTTISHVAAKQELRSLISSLRIDLGLAV